MHGLISFLIVGSAVFSLGCSCWLCSNRRNSSQKRNGHNAGFHTSVASYLLCGLKFRRCQAAVDLQALLVGGEEDFLTGIAARRVADLPSFYRP